jgi:hypothetical protein
MMNPQPNSDFRMLDDFIVDALPPEGTEAPRPVALEVNSGMQVLQASLFDCGNRPQEHPQSPDPTES